MREGQCALYLPSPPPSRPSRLIGNIFGARETQKCCLRASTLERADG